MKLTTVSLLSVFACVAAFAAETSTELNFKLDPAMRARTTAVQNTVISPGFGKTIWGPTGLIFIPSAFTVGTGNLAWGVTLADDFNTASATYGIAQDIEVGLAYLNRDNSDNKVIANAKIHIVPANFDQLRLAIGIMDAADAVSQSFYVVASMPLITPEVAEAEGAIGLIGHLGVGSGYFSEKPFMGAELLFARGFTATAEWDSKNVNLALRYDFRNEFFVQVGSYSAAPFFKLGYTMRF